MCYIAKNTKKMTAREVIDALQRAPEYLDREVYFALYPSEEIDEFQRYRVDDVTFYPDMCSPHAVDWHPDYVELGTDQS